MRERAFTGHGSGLGSLVKSHLGLEHVNFCHLQVGWERGGQVHGGFGGGFKKLGLGLQLWSVAWEGFRDGSGSRHLIYRHRLEA